MKIKFHGGYEALKKLVLMIGIDGEWRDLGNQKQYRAMSGAILNWWESTGTILFQGKAAVAASFQEAFLSYATDMAERVNCGERATSRSRD